MKTIAKVGLGCLGALGAWGLLLAPRRNQPGWEALEGVRYAHRGLHDPDRGVPENSMAAFRRAVWHGFGAELDVHLMADGELAVVHDSSLKRVCGVDVCVEDLTAGQLKNYPLMGTEETIPLFREVLELFEGKTPLVIELKAERGNAALLTDRVMAALKGWNGTYCVESFHPAVLLRLRERYPHVLRGQLSQNFLKDSEVGNLSLPARFVLTNLLTTALTKPDFIAYHWKDRGNPSLRLMRRLYGVHEVGWTVRDRETMERLSGEGVTSIFEGFEP
ncbi:MAG: glycerophosphodiester phosphodiesterase [Oscillospiraceae bacterium]|nr:glycerophosphodiester phosphodiesterase [Oscillospiraceae bacterium]